MKLNKQMNKSYLKDLYTVPNITEKLKSVIGTFFLEPVERFQSFWEIKMIK